MNLICGVWGVGSVLSPAVARLAHRAFGARLDGFYIAAGALAVSGLLIGLAQSPGKTRAGEGDTAASTDDVDRQVVLPGNREKRPLR